MTSKSDPKAIFIHVRDLPVLPQALVDLMTALQSDDVAVDDIANRIGRDQALAAKALRLANCSFYGVAGRVHSIRDAVNVLGLRTLSSALVAAAVSNSFTLRDCPLFDIRAYWRHSMAAGLCAQAIADHLGLDASSAFVAGLLHDIGKLALAAQLPGPSTQVEEYRMLHDVQADEAEQSVLGTDHAQVGGQVARHWHFAEEMAQAIESHHCPANGAQASLSDIVHVADNMAHALDLSGAAWDLVPRLSLAAWDRLALVPATCVSIFQKTECGLEELCDALGI